MSGTARLYNGDRSAYWDVPLNRLQHYHTITISHGGWHMAHPITCHLDQCEFDRVARREAEAWAVGVYRWDDPDGELAYQGKDLSE